MSVVLVLMLASLLVGLTFLACFVWAVSRGQYEDLETPAMRMLTDDEDARGQGPRAKQKGKRPHE